MDSYEWREDLFNTERIIKDLNSELQSLANEQDEIRRKLSTDIPESVKSEALLRNLKIHNRMTTARHQLVSAKSHQRDLLMMDISQFQHTV